MTWLAFSILISVAAGALPVRMLFPRRARRAFRLPDDGWELLVQVSLSIGLGVGFTTLVWFWLLVVVGSVQPSFPLCEAGVTALLAQLVYSVSRCRMARPDTPDDQPCPRPAQASPVPEALGIWNSNYRLLKMMLLVAALWTLYWQVHTALIEPHGGWDAWATWNLKARFLFRSGADWKRVFSPLMQFYRADYPLMIPLAVSRFWYYAGGETQVVPITIGIVFTFATLLLLVGTVGVVADRERALMAGLGLLGGRYFVTSGISQYADTPLSFFFLATAAMMLLRSHYRQPRYGLVVLASLCAGISGWVKNEGTLFVACFGAVVLAVEVWQRGLISALRTLAAFGAGVAVSVPSIVYLKTAFGASNDLVNQRVMGESLDKLLDPARYVEITQTTLCELFDPWSWGVIVPIMILTALLVGFEVRKELRAGTWAVILMVGGMCAGYFAIYLVTPYNLTWHLEKSISRLVVQLWPCAVLVYFSSLAWPRFSGNPKKLNR